MAMREPNAKLRPRLLISLVAFLLVGALWATTIPRLTVTLMSDPHGVDLRPYLDQVQRTIAREWMRSWRPDWSSEGQVTIRFSVDRSGKVLKLVIASSSRLADLARLSHFRPIFGMRTRKFLLLSTSAPRKSANRG